MFGIREDVSGKTTFGEDYVHEKLGAPF